MSAERHDDREMDKSWITAAKNKTGKSGLIRQLFLRSYYHISSYPIIRIMAHGKLKVKKNRIAFISDIDYSDNCRVLFEYMIQKDYWKEYEFIWIVRDRKKYKNKHLPSTRFVGRNAFFTPFEGIRAHYFVWTSQIVFFSHSVKWAPKKNPLQCYINLWHGCGYKDTKGGRNEIQFDWLLVPSDLFRNTKAKFFGCEMEKILPVGYPRYDLMLKKENQKQQFFAEEKIVHKAEKMILWMPTFRKTDQIKIEDDTIKGETGLPIYYSMESLNHLDQFCAEKKILLFIKKHPFQAEYQMKEKAYQNLCFLDDDWLEKRNLQLFEMMAEADAMISDYSSASVDYLLLNRPIAYTLDDYEEYKKSRGFVFADPLAYMPGDHLYTEDDFCRFLTELAAGQDSFANQRKEICRQFHNETEYGFCERILDSFQKLGVLKTGK